MRSSCTAASEKPLQQPRPSTAKINELKAEETANREQRHIFGNLGVKRAFLSKTPKATRENTINLTALNFYISMWRKHHQDHKPMYQKKKKGRSSKVKKQSVNILTRDKQK